MREIKEATMEIRRKLCDIGKDLKGEIDKLKADNEMLRVVLDEIDKRCESGWCSCLCRKAKKELKAREALDKG